MSKKGEYIFENSPTLNTVLMVENTLMNMDKSTFTIQEIKEKLPKKVSHKKLITILNYLEKSNKIIISMKGITWIHNTNPNLRKDVSKGYET